MTPFLGMIIAVGFNFAPSGWAFCNGQLLSIASNTALFSLLGTFYGGDGSSTFALPDLRGRTIIHFGQGTGLSSFSIGEVGGTETMTLSVENMPAHTHSLIAENNLSGWPHPSGKVLGAPSSDMYVNTASVTSPVALDPQSISNTGGGAPFSKKPPYLAMNYIIALTGVFPSRN